MRLFDELSVRLHLREIDHLITVLYRVRDKGNPMLVLKHDTSVIPAADWIIDIGPEVGWNGGTVVAEGTPETVAEKHAISLNGRLLKEWLKL